MRIAFLFRIFFAGCWSLARIILMVCVALLALIGAAAIPDALHKTNLPTIYPTRVSCGSLAAPRHARERLLAMSREQKWNLMQGAIHILDIACPTIADWVRLKWYRGQLVFSTDDHCYGWYVPASGILGMTLEGLLQSDVELCVTLAHEFRHSRQTLFKSIQVSISDLFGIDRRYELVEAEAYQFEDKVRQAIRCTP